VKHNQTLLLHLTSLHVKACSIIRPHTPPAPYEPCTCNAHAFRMLQHQQSPAHDMHHTCMSHAAALSAEPRRAPHMHRTCISNAAASAEPRTCITHAFRMLQQYQQSPAHASHMLQRQHSHAHASRMLQHEHPPMCAEHARRLRGPGSSC
jgi:hypothetical protein